MSEPIPIRDYKTNYSLSLDLRGNPIGDVCLCGCTVFKALVSFEGNELAMYFLDAECLNCGSLLTLSTPEDGNDCI